MCARFLWPCWPWGALAWVRCLAAALQVKGENDTVNVKRLPKKKAPPRFGRKLTAQQKANATHICVGARLILLILSNPTSHLLLFMPAA